MQSQCFSIDCHLVARNGCACILKSITLELRVKTGQTKSNEQRGLGSFHLSFLLIRFEGHIQLYLYNLSFKMKSIFFQRAKFRNYCCCCSVAKSCPTLCDPKDYSTPGFPVLHYLPEFAQIHVHWVTDRGKFNDIFAVSDHTYNGKGSNK